MLGNGLLVRRSTLVTIRPGCDTHREYPELLEVQPELGMTELVWIRRSVSGSLVTQIKERLARIELLRSVGVLAITDIWTPKELQ